MGCYLCQGNEAAGWILPATSQPNLKKRAAPLFTNFVSKVFTLVVCQTDSTEICGKSLKSPPWFRPERAPVTTDNTNCYGSEMLGIGALMRRRQVPTLPLSHWLKSPMKQCDFYASHPHFSSSDAKLSIWASKSKPTI